MIIKKILNLNYQKNMVYKYYMKMPNKYIIDLLLLIKTYLSFYKKFRQCHKQLNLFKNLN